MEKFKVVLLVLVAGLMLMLVIDRSRTTEQINLLKQAVDQANTALAKISNDAIAMRPSDTAQSQGHSEKDPNRDGNPKLDVNFLMPYDRSWHHPEWVGGTISDFEEAPNGLNVLINNSSGAGDVASLTNDSLCDRPALHPYQWSENLSTSVVISDDYKTYTFIIRKGVKWQRAEIAKLPKYAWLNQDVELTAHDFKFWVDVMMNPDTECPQVRTYYEDLDKAEVVDSHTLRVTWKRKVYTSLSASMGLSPLPRHIYGSNADGTPIPEAQWGVRFNKHWFDEERQVVGVGGYCLDSYEPDKVISFRRNPDYWGVAQHFERLRWDGEVKQPDAQLVAFKNGQVQAHGLIPSQYKSEILDHAESRFAALDPNNPKAGRAGELGWERIKSNSFSYIGWNMRTDLFKDKRVRHAMSHAFPKQRIIDDVYFGLGTPTLTDVHPSIPYCNLDLKPYEFDLDKAAALLKQAGWSDSDGDGILDQEFGGKKTKFLFKVKYYANSPEWDRTLLIYRDQLKKIGIDLDPQSFEWKELIRIYESRDFDAVVGGWRMDLEIDYFQLWHSSQADQAQSSNHCGFKNAEVDQLADVLRTTFETEPRIAIAKRIQAILHEEQPYTFFRSSEGIFAWQNKGPPAQDRYLDGVIQGLDTLPPLYNRSRVYWHFRN
jgi:ABC-type transport system substrate-binding protein